MGKRLTLLAVCLIAAVPAHAQQPANPEANAVVEPLPYPSAMVYGQAQKPYIPPYMGKGLPPCIEGDTPNCFSNIPPAEKTYSDFPGWYAYSGTVLYLRNRNPASPTVYRLPDADGSEPGLPTPPGTEVFGTLSDVSPGLHWGMTSTIGYHWDNEAIEFVSTWLPMSRTSQNYLQPWRLNTPFYNATDMFAGNNGMFRDADMVSMTMEQMYLSFELNGRICLDWHPCLEVIAGARFAYLQEGLIHTTIDDMNVPEFYATYTSRTTNRIFGPQLGAEWMQMCCEYIGFGANIKGTWGVNWATTNLNLQRGDGVFAFYTNRDSRAFAQLYEGGIFLDFYFMQRGRLRAGYEFLWLNGVSEAASQIDFNLANTQGIVNTNGNVFFYGPRFELHLLF